MPVAFPSHQGLILPLWRWLPRRFEGVALSVGAAMPDILDTALWPFRAGELGQWAGHSLVGVLACIPAGLVVTWLVRRAVPGRLLARLEDPPGSPPPSPGRASASLGIGALSHVLSDLVTHCHFWLFWPWYTGDDVFPAWWCHAWAKVPLPIYREPYPLAPHTIAWFVVSLLGAILFVRCLRPAR